MQTYAKFSPTAVDQAGAFLDDRQDCLVLPVSRTRDSGPLDDSNVDAALEILGGESDTVELHRFGHWGPGWFEIVLVHPSRKADAEGIARRLEHYPVLDEEDLSRREQEEADRIWKTCYSASERVAYIRAHPNEFEFRDFSDVAWCVRGNHFAGYASELIG